MSNSTPQTTRSTGRQLADAMAKHEPACAGDERFTSDLDRTDKHTEHELLATCFGCPLLAACDAYASSTRPTAGFWAGRWRGSPARRAKAAPAEQPDGAHFPGEQEVKGARSQ